jgi:membrane protein DedA with SNARE-associated domain
MDGLEAFLNAYGVAAACTIMLVKAVGVPVPIPGDLILLGIAARAAEGKVVVWLAFAGLLLAILAGGLIQFWLARGPARGLVLRYGGRLGLTAERLERVAARMRQVGPLGIGVAVLTPGVRSAVIPACGLTGFPVRPFLLGLVLGTTVDLGLHFAIGFAGSTLLSASPIAIVVLLAVVGLGAWLYIARRRGATRVQAVTAWTQATCPVCLTLGALVPQNADPAVRWEGAA